MVHSVKANKRRIMQTRTTKAAPRRLWDVQKQEREERIIEAAAALFAERGFEATSIEAIAEQAGLAVGTVYNYFTNKTALLMRVVLRGRPESLAQLAESMDELPDEPVEAIFRFLVKQTRGALRHDKRLWRVVHSTTAWQPEAFGREYVDSLRQVLDLLTELLTRLQQKGTIAADVSIHDASRVISVVAMELYRRFVSDEDMTFTQLEQQLRPRIAVIVSGLAPR